MRKTSLRLRLVAVVVVGAIFWIGRHHRTALPTATATASATATIARAAAPARVIRRGEVQLTECELKAPHSAAPPAHAYCAVLEVPENRARPSARQVTLHLAVIPSQAARPAADAVTFLDGGPGGAALADYPLVAQSFAPLQKARDILLIDQRGTGQSNPLQCPPAQNTELLARVRACAAHVATRADPRYYTTADASADLEAVRVQLGYPQLTVIGVSYGTRVAQIYARDYPRSVRALVLDSPVPNTLVLGSEHARNLENTLQARFQACVADSPCKARFQNPYATLSALSARLEAHPIDVTVADPITHAIRTEHLTRASVAQLVRFYAYSPLSMALLPLTLDEAQAGRYTPLLTQLLQVEGDLSTRLEGGMELSVLCTEDAPLLREDPADAHTVLGSAFVRQAQQACTAWPHAPMPAHFHDPLTGAVPTLLLSGELDPVTPPRYAQAIADHLSQARVLTLPGQGHAVMGVGCAPEVVARFVAKADAATLDAHCLARERAAPFFLDYAGPSP